MEGIIVRLVYLFFGLFSSIITAEAAAPAINLNVIDNYKHCDQSKDKNSLDACCDKYEADKIKICRKMEGANNLASAIPGNKGPYQDSDIAYCKGLVNQNYVKCINFPLPKKRVTSAIRQMM